MGLRNAACIHIPPRVIWHNGQNAKKKKIKATKHHSANRTVQPLVFYGQHVSFTNLKTAAVCVQG